MNIMAITDRLELREFTLADAEGFFQLNEDPEVIKFTGDRAFRDISETRRLIETYDHYDKYGFGRWSVYHRKTGVYMGFCGLKYSPEKEETDIGFRLIRKYWHAGYATEAALASLSVGFEQYHLTKIVGRAMKDNLASHRVLLKLGMTEVFEFEEEGITWVQYEITKDDYQKLL